MSNGEHEIRTPKGLRIGNRSVVDGKNMLQIKRGGCEDYISAESLVECIENQRMLLHDYIGKQEDLFGEIVEYVDDGYTGTNFNRPAFQKMIVDLKQGDIKVIMVKDYCAIIGLNQKDLENQGILA